MRSVPETSPMHILLKAVLERKVLWLLALVPLPLLLAVMQLLSSRSPQQLQEP